MTVIHSILLNPHNEQRLSNCRVNKKIFETLYYFLRTTKASWILNKYKWRQRRDPLLDLPHRLIVDKYFYPFTTDVRTIGNKLFITAVSYKTNKTNGYRKGHQDYLYNIGIL